MRNAASPEAITAALAYLDCSRLNYDEWLHVGMALKSEGFDLAAWDSWSATDPARYSAEDCALKWNSFRGEGVTGRTVCHLAKQHGWDGATAGGTPLPNLGEPARRKAAPKYPIIKGLSNLPTLPEPPTEPADMLRAQIEALFNPGELVNTNVFNVKWNDKRGKFEPNGWGEFTPCEGTDPTKILGCVKPDRGAYIRVNPMDGKGGSDKNATAYRTALVECDGLDKGTQWHEYRRLNLPCACVVDSGNKSVHAFVRIDAANASEYRKRVEWLHGFLNANLPQPEGGSIPVDAANKNPARWARLAGAMRGDHMQALMATACGAPSWDAWRAWVDAQAGSAGGGENPTAWESSPQAKLVEYIRRDEWLRGRFGTNMLDGGRYVTGALPWDELADKRRWTDADTEHLWCYLQEKTGVRNRRDVAGALTIAVAENRFNPIADMLDELPAWDGEARADYLLWALFGCKDGDYTRAISHTFMRGAVLRAYEPGCKFDAVLVLIGRQGCGKSYGTRQLVMGHDALLCESVTDLTDPKLTAEQTGGKWIVELAELEGMTGRRLTAVKQAITMQSATVRMAYAREAIDLPRSCVFVATTNEAEFLADPTGARRFWPVRCAVDENRNGWHDASAAQVRAFIVQAWAEVVAEYKAARSAYPDPDAFRAAFPTTLSQEGERMADEARDAASVEDTRIGVIREWLDTARLRDGITRVTSRMVAERALNIDMTRQRGNKITTEVAFILTNNCPGWVSVGKQRVDGYGVSRAWEWRGTDA